MGNREALFAMSLGSILMWFVRSRNLGVVGAPDAILRFQAGRNRMRAQALEDQLVGGGH